MGEEGTPQQVEELKGRARCCRGWSQRHRLGQAASSPRPQAPPNPLLVMEREREA